MFIGSLKERKAKTKIKYTYRKRGLDEKYYPDFPSEAEEAECYGTDGQLFQGFVGFNGTKLLDRAIDIKIDLGRECFVDQLCFSQGEGSEISEIIVFSEKKDGLMPVGIYESETEKRISEKEISVVTGVRTEKLVLRIKGGYKHVVIGRLDILGGVDIEKAVYPLPERIRETGGFLESITGIDAKEADEAFAGANFAEKYNKQFGTQIKMNNGNISFRLADMGEEEFEINVTQGGAKITGGSRRALLYASEKLLQLCDKKGIRTAEIFDRPFMELRAVHIGLPDRAQLPFLKRMVKYVFMPMGYNMVFIQLSGVMEYKSHPKINDAWQNACKKYEAGEWPMPAHYTFMGHDILSHEEVRDLCEYIRSYGMEIVPEVQSFGHTQYITMAYPRLGEREIRQEKNINLFDEDGRPESFYTHCMCPNHPDYYSVIFDIIDEVIDVIKPERYLHIGHDEIYTIGKCDCCRNTPEEEIYAKEVTALHDHLKERGLITMMWSDMIQERTYASAKAIDMIPKDIICLSFTWYFHLDEDTEEILYDHGYKVMIGNLYSSHYTRFNKRKYGRRLIGAQISTWVPCNELYYGFEGKSYDFVYTANMLWNEEFRQEMRRTYGEMVNKVTLRLRSEIGNSVMEGDGKSLQFAKDEKAVPFDIRNSFGSVAHVGAGQELTIPVSGKAKKISFLHATDTSSNRIPWKAPEKVGSYYIRYADGGCDEAEILYGANICEYKRAYGEPIKSALFRHEGYIATCLTTPLCGKTCEGKDFSLYEYTWVNPQPDREIKEIQLRHGVGTDAAILLFDVKTSV